MKIEILTIDICEHIICIYFNEEDVAEEWSQKTGRGRVFKSDNGWDVDCSDVNPEDFLKVCWSAWCAEQGIS